MQKNVQGAIIALLLAASASPAVAGPEVDACGALAATVYDVGYETTGLYRTQIDENKAIPACEAAVAAEPESLEAKAWLGRVLLEAGRAGEARPLFEAAANGGNVVGKVFLATELLKGSPEEAARGAELLKEVAKSGSVMGRLEYAYMREVGNGGVTASPDAALTIFTDLYERGDSDAANYIGLYYYYGYGGQTDPAEATVWWQLGADMGNVSSMRNLALNYQDGYGVEQDPAKAFEWMNRSADLGASDAISDVGLYYERGTGTEVDLAAAASYYRHAAELGDYWGLVNYGRALVNASGVEQDFAAAIPYFEAAIARGDFEAYGDLAIAYLNGDGVEKDLAKSKEYYELGIAAGSAFAKRSYAYELMEGTNFPLDLERGIALTREAAEQGEDVAMNNLAWAYMRGTGVPVDWDEARIWIEKAIPAGNDYAYGNLAELYERGVAGFPQDIEKAKELYAQGVALGDTWSQEQLDRIARGEPPEVVE